VGIKEHDLLNEDKNNHLKRKKKLLTHCSAKTCHVSANKHYRSVWIFFELVCQTLGKTLF
jgi:hypothetical protein